MLPVGFPTAVEIPLKQANGDEYAYAVALNTEIKSFWMRTLLLPPRNFKIKRVNNATFEKFRRI